MLRVQLRYLTGSKSGTVEVYPTGRFAALHVGRDAGCDIRFRSDRERMVSRNHAMIEWQAVEGEPTRFSISDLLSSNGTFVNGVRVGQSAPLAPGDHIRFGHGGPEAIFDVDDPEMHEPDDRDTPFRVHETSEIPALEINATLLRGRVSR